jgi:hypothetical protein
MTVQKSPFSLALRQCASRKPERRRKSTAPVSSNCMSTKDGLAHRKGPSILRLRLCASSKMTGAKQLAHVICASAPVPYIGTGATDRRTAAMARAGVAQRALIPYAHFARTVFP